MARSIRRLSLEARSAPVNQPIYPLADLEAAYQTHHQELNHSLKTIERYKQSFGDFHRFLKETKRKADTSVLSTDTMSDYARWLRETPIRGWRGKTERSIYGVHGRLKDMRAFFAWAEEEDYIDRAPRVKLPKLPKTIFPILSDEQVKQLLSCHHLTSGGPQAIRNQAIIALMIETGIRLSEVSGMNLEDIDFDRGQIKIRGKGSKERMVFFTPAVTARLNAWLKIRGTDEGSFFDLTTSGIQSLFVRIKKETGLPIHPHLLRHQAATYLVRNHADLHTVKRIMGHSTVTVTEGYLSLDTEDLRAKHAAASPFEMASSLIEPPRPERKKRRRLEL